jgi:hypothetical protein
MCLFIIIDLKLVNDYMGHPRQQTGGTVMNSTNGRHFGLLRNMDLHGGNALC